MDKNTFDEEHVFGKFSDPDPNLLLVAGLVGLFFKDQSFLKDLIRYFTNYPNYAYLELTTIEEIIIDVDPNLIEDRIQEIPEKERTFFESQCRKHYEAYISRLDVTEKEIDIYVDCLKSGVSLHEGITGPKKIEFSKEILVNDFLNMKLSFLERFFTPIIDFYIKTNQHLISKREDALKYLIFFYENLLNRKDKKANLLVFLGFIGGKVFLTKETSDRYIEALLKILKEKETIIERQFSIVPDTKWKRQQNKNEYSSNETRAGIYGLVRAGFLSGKNKSLLGESLSSVTGHSASDIRKIKFEGPSGIEVILQERGTGNIEYYTGLRAVKMCEDAMNILKKDMRDLGYMGNFDELK